MARKLAGFRASGPDRGMWKGAAELRRRFPAVQRRRRDIFRWFSVRQSDGFARCDCRKGFSAVRHDLRKAQHVDGGGSSAQQRPAGGIRRRARREDIVDQHHAPAGEARPCLLGHAEHALQILPPLGSREADLLARRSHAAEEKWIAGASRILRNGLGERCRLIEPPHPEPPAVQRHWDDDVDLAEKVGSGPRHRAPMGRASRSWSPYLRR
jgi:hypothetical protein